MMLISLFVSAASPQAMPAMDHATIACPATPLPLPAGLKGWERKQPVHAAETVKTATPLPIGTGVAAILLPTSQIGYAVEARGGGGANSNGGMFAFTVAMAGRYRVALGAGAWVDVLRGTTPAPSVAHAHGPACTGVRKLVDFDLTPGRHVLQVAGSESPTLGLMVARIP